ncbi:MAG TPA: ABC transporter permease [Gaiellales bacterium]|nr:ABC transporter permease [Gaiellales bacterium]
MQRSDYIIKRTLFAVLTVFVAVTLNFLLFRALPGNAVSGLKCRACTIQFKKAVAHDMGLDKSKWEQYVIYLKNLAHGDMGYTAITHKPVRGELWDPIKNTLAMITLGTVFSIIFGVFTGVISAWRRGTWLDKGSVWTALAFYSVPTQWLGLMIVYFVADRVGLPHGGIQSPDFGILGNPGTYEFLVDRTKHMILPALTLGLVLYGDYTLIVRSAMLETLGEDYVLTARAKGMSNWEIVWKHGFRNAMLPVVTLIALSLGFIIGGAITIEYVFDYPGIGLAIVDAIDKRDYAFLQGAFLVLTLSVIFCNFVADLLYFKLDPRVTT